MKKNNLFQAIVNAVVQEEKKKFARSPRDLFLDQKKQRWYRIMNLLDELEEQENPEETSEK